MPQGSGAVDWENLASDGVHVVHDIFGLVTRCPFCTPNLNALLYSDGDKKKEDKRALYDLLARSVPEGSGAVDWDSLVDDSVHVMHDILE